MARGPRLRGRRRVRRPVRRDGAAPPGAEARRAACRLPSGRVRAAPRRTLRRRADGGARRRSARPLPRPPQMNSFTGRKALHLLVLCTFAFAQPLFDLLGKTPEFFVVRGSRTVDTVVFALVVVLLPPTVLVAVEALVALVSRAAAVVVHLVFIGALAAIVALQVARDHSGSTLVVGAVSAAAGAAFAALYRRTRGVPMFLTVLGPAPILFLALFLFRPPLLE